jgi:DNA repair protein RadC
MRSSCPFGALGRRKLPDCRRGEFPIQRLVLERGHCRRWGPKVQIRSSADAVKLVRDEFAGRAQEEMLMVLLDTAHQVISVLIVGVGGISSVGVDPRLVLGSAVAAGAPKILLAHNHPSGRVDPSADDEAMTGKIAKGAREVGLVLVDHVIVGNDGDYFSFAEHGHL